MMKRREMRNGRDRDGVYKGLNQLWNFNLSPDIDWWEMQQKTAVLLIQRTYCNLSVSDRESNLLL